MEFKRKHGFGRAIAAPQINDHLEGILAVQRAIDNRSFALESQRDRLK